MSFDSHIVPVKFVLSRFASIKTRYNTIETVFEAFHYLLSIFLFSLLSPLPLGRTDRKAAGTQKRPEHWEGLSLREKESQHRLKN